MTDMYISTVKSAFPELEIADYVVTLKVLKGLGNLIPIYNTPEQLIIFLTLNKAIIVMRITRFGKLLPPEKLEHASILRLPSFFWKRIKISNSDAYTGSYNVIRKHKHGKYQNKEEFIQQLIRS